MAVDITLKQLRAFIAVLECGSFSEAAERMFLSQAALSGLIKELEGRLGVRLLERSTRSVRASVVGEAFEPLVRRVLEDLDQAMQSVVSLKELRRGWVRIAAPEPLSCTLLPELLFAYGQNHPGIELKFEDVPIEEVLEGLRNGRIDIGFGPVGVGADDAIEVHPLQGDPLWVALRQDDPLATQEAVTWRQLRDRMLINYMPNLGRNVLSRLAPGNHPQQVMQVHRVNTALSQLRVRPGYVLCPAMARHLVDGFGLAFRPIRQPQVIWQIAMFARHRQQLSPAVESFLAFALGRAASD